MAVPTVNPSAVISSLSAADRLQYRILRRFWPGEATPLGEAFAGRSKIRMQLGERVFGDLLACDSIVDFGCGAGTEAIELAKAGCRRVIGLDIQDNLLVEARASAARAGVDVEFCRPPVEAKVDAVISIDAFEHFGDPDLILRLMFDLLKPGGRVFTAFGPTWYHPLGGHLFSVFPWAHLVFSERAFCAWRSHLRSDGAMRFADCAGGLNRITIERFERMVAASPLTLESIECVPIRRLQPVANRFTREFTTAIVRAVLRRPE